MPSPRSLALSFCVYLSPCVIQRFVVNRTISPRGYSSLVGIPTRRHENSHFTYKIQTYSQVIGELEAMIQLLPQSFKVPVEFADDSFRLGFILTIHAGNAIHERLTIITDRKFGAMMRASHETRDNNMGIGFSSSPVPTFFTYL